MWEGTPTRSPAVSIGLLIASVPVRIGESVTLADRVIAAAIATSAIIPVWTAQQSTLYDIYEQWAEMKMVRWMCGIKLKDRFQVKGWMTRIRWHNLGTTVVTRQNGLLAKLPLDKVTPPKLKQPIVCLPMAFSPLITACITQCPHAYVVYGVL